MSTGNKMARRFAIRMAGFALTIQQSKDTAGLHAPGSRPGNTGCGSLPNGQGRGMKGRPSDVSARLRQLAKDKGTVYRHGI